MNRQSPTNCETCTNYVYDDEYDCFVCMVYFPLPANHAIDFEAKFRQTRKFTAALLTQGKGN